MHLSRRLLSNCLISMASKTKARIAVCQMTAKADKEENFSVCKALLEEAVDAKAQVFVFKDINMPS